MYGESRKHDMYVFMKFDLYTCTHSASWKHDMFIFKKFNKVSGMYDVSRKHMYIFMKFDRYTSKHGKSQSNVFIKFNLPTQGPSKTMSTTRKTQAIVVNNKW